MKKLIVIQIMLLSMPAFALCPISQDGSCKLTENIKTNMPIFQNINTNNGNETNNMQIPNSSSSLDRPKNKKGVLIEGSLGCKFGNCSHGLNNDFLENQ